MIFPLEQTQGLFQKVRTCMQFFRKRAKKGKNVHNVQNLEILSKWAGDYMQ